VHCQVLAVRSLTLAQPGDLCIPRVDDNDITGTEHLQFVTLDHNSRLFIRSDTDLIGMVQDKAQKPIDSLPFHKVRIEKNV